MKTQTLGVLLVLVLLMLPMAAAISTEINVKAPLDRSVTILVVNPSDKGYQLYDSYHLDSGGIGKVTASYTGTQEKVGIRVIISDNGVKELNWLFGDFGTGSPLYLQAIPDAISNDYTALETVTTANETAAANETNTTSENDVTTLEENASTGSSFSFGAISGFATRVKGYIFSTTAYYILGGLILVGIIIFLVRRGTFSNISSIFNRPPHMSSGVRDGNTEKILRDAQDKIKEARSQIALVRNARKIEEAKRMLEEDKQRLESLMRGDEEN